MTGSSGSVAAAAFASLSLAGTGSVGGLQTGDEGGLIGW